MEEPFLQALFSLKRWYEPKYGDDDFVRIQDTLWNEFEKENVRAILANQKKRGFVDDQPVDDEAVDYKVPRSIVEGSYIDLDGDGLGERVVFDFMYAGPYQIAKEYMVMINPKVPGDFKLSGVIDSMRLPFMRLVWMEKQHN